MSKGGKGKVPGMWDATSKTRERLEDHLETQKTDYSSFGPLDTKSIDKLYSRYRREAASTQYLSPEPSDKTGSGGEASSFVQAVGQSLQFILPPGSLKGRIKSRLQEKADQARQQMRTQMLLKTIEESERKIEGIERSHANRVRESEKQDRIGRMEANRQHEDIFKWVPLQGCSKANAHLKSLVRTRLIEILTDPDTMRTVEERIAKCREELANTPISQQQQVIAQHRITLEDYLDYSVSRNGYRDVLAHFSPKPPIPTKDGRVMVSSAQHIDEKSKHAQEGGKSLLSQSILFVKDDKATSREPMEWSASKEQLFKQRKKECRDLLKYAATGQNYSDICMSEYIHNMVYDNRATDLRESILNKYLDGMLLTDQETRLLALTSKEINRFIDRNSYTQYIQMFDPEFIQHLEINIAEQILEDYFKARREVAVARDKYLSTKASKVKQQIFKWKPEKEHEVRDELTLYLNRQQQQVTKKLILQKIFSTMVDPKTDNAELERFKAVARMALSRVNKAKEAPRPSTAPPLRDFHPRKVKLKSTIYGDLAPAEHAKLTHPPSKIIPLSMSNGRKELAKYLIDEQKKRRNLSLDAKPKDTQTRFYQSYSSGPLRGKRHRARYSPQQRDRAALIIQRNWRGYLTRKAVKFLRSLQADSDAHKAQEAHQKSKPILKGKVTTQTRIPTEASEQHNIKLKRKVTFQGGTNPIHGRSLTNVSLQGHSRRSSPRKVRESSSASSSQGRNLLSKQRSLSSLNADIQSSDHPPLHLLSRQPRGEKNGKTIPTHPVQGRGHNRVPSVQEISAFTQAMLSKDIPSLESTPSPLLRYLLHHRLQGDDMHRFPVEIAVQMNSLGMVDYLFTHGLDITKCRGGDITQVGLLNMSSPGSRVRAYLQELFRQHPPSQYILKVPGEVCMY